MLTGIRFLAGAMIARLPLRGVAAAMSATMRAACCAASLAFTSIAFYRYP